MLRKPHMNKHYATVVLMGKWNKKQRECGTNSERREEGRSSGLIHL